VAELRSEESLTYASPLEAVDLFIGRHYGEKLVGQAVLNPGVTEIFERMMTFTEGSNEFYFVPVPEELVGRPFREAQLWALDRSQDQPVTPVGIDRSLTGGRLWLNPAAGEAGLTDEDLVLREADRLVVLAYEHPAFAISEEERWSGRILLRR
jgi:hypothetical protein